MTDQEKAEALLNAMQAVLRLERQMRDLRLELETARERLLDARNAAMTTTTAKA